jgi:thiamine biosynthesis lipoprotein
MLREVLQHSGYRKLVSRDAPHAIRKEDPLLRLDLSAIAKGYAVDQLAYLLEYRGLRNYLIEIGGEIRTAGTHSDGKPWRIGIQPPADGLDLEFVVVPGDAAVATSGDYQNFYMLAGRKVSHTIDPGSARPVENGLTSVSVIAPDAMQADALATTLMVMGPDAGLKFAEEQYIPALFFVREKGAIRTFYTAEFKNYLLVN